MKIVFLDASTIGDVSLTEKIKSFGDLQLFDATVANQTVERIEDAEVVITNKVIIDRAVMDTCPNLKLVCIAATGMNNVDLDYAKEKGIVINNVSGYSSESVAQHTFTILLSLLGQINYYDHYVKSGEYSKSPIFTHVPRSFWELKGKTFGVIGLGNIGRRVAEIAQMFGAKVVYYSTSGKNDNPDFESLSLKDLLKQSDVVSIHAPLNEQTKYLISYVELQQMKPTAVLLNTGRGGIIDEVDLARALNENLIAGAGIDVFEKEPIAKDNPLLSIINPDKLILTPHTAWTSLEARRQLIDGICENIQSYINRQEGV